MRLQYWISGTALCGLAVSLSSVAPAQPAPATHALEEVLVTARKREESILKVPVVTTVLSIEKMEQFAIRDMDDIARSVPGLLIGGAQLSIGPQISMRGVGTTNLDAGVDQSISLNIDGMPISQSLAYKAGVFDLLQAEVLKGPQALFYGKNSPGG